MTHRNWLVDNLTILVAQLWRAGVADVFIAGSFVQNNPNPGDIDGYYLVDPRRDARLLARLNGISPLFIQATVPATWRFSPEQNKPKCDMWHQHRVELFLEDAHRSGQDGSWAALFKKTKKDGKPKGIIHIVR